MRTDTLKLSIILPVPASRLYHDWLNSTAHAAFTGSPVDINAVIGGLFSAWDSYIQGSTLEMQANRRIMQTWRTSDFPEHAPDSVIEVLFEPLQDKGKKSTRLTIRQSRIPAGQAAEYEQGWRNFYFDPMLAYYTDQSPK